MSAVGLKGEVILHKLEDDNIIVGTGSACSSKNPFSRVLKEAGYNSSVLDGVIRISFTPEITNEELDYVVEKLNLNTKIPLIDWSSDNTSIKRRVFFTLKP